MRSLGRNANGNHNTQSRHLPRCQARKLLLCAALRGLKWKRQSHCNGDRISQTAGSVLTQNLNDLLLHRKLIIVILAGNIAQNWIYISIVRNDTLGRVVTADQPERWSLFSIFGGTQTSTEEH